MGLGGFSLARSIGAIWQKFVPLSLAGQGELLDMKGSYPFRRLKVKQKIGKRRINREKPLKPLEDELHLSTMMQYAIEGYEDLGAFVLAKSKSKKNGGSIRFRFTFGFQLKGVQSALTDAEVEHQVEKIEGGLKDLLPGEKITFHLASFSSDTERQNQLRELAETAPSPELKFLLVGDRKRTRELRDGGKRKPKSLHCYVTYTVDTSSVGTQDWIENLLARVGSSWTAFKGQTEEFQYEQLSDICLRAFTDGFSLWEQILSTKMGLEVKPLGHEELWGLLWRRFNKSKPGAIPHRLIYDHRGLHEEVSGSVHATTLLINDEVPYADRRWIHFKDNYCAALTLLDKPAGWSDLKSQIRYLWQFLARDSIVDTEIFCELTPANPRLVSDGVQRVLKQSNVSAKDAEEHSSVDVNARTRFRRSIEAQEEMVAGAVPIYTSIAILVHRKRRDRLDEACRHISNCFQRPAWVARETEYAWKVWLQTLPIVWEPLLGKPYERRHLFLSNEVPGLMPLVCTHLVDKKGFELIAAEGGTPIHLDLYDSHKNIGIFGTTRSGKSVVLGGLFTMALAKNIPVVALDYPKPDGTSTFSDYTRFVNGSYFDIGKERINLFELPDLRQLPVDKQYERLADYKDFLESALLAMIVGSDENQSLAQTVRSLLSLALNSFFDDDEIKSRYEQAIQGGFGSSAHKKTPTLRDFLSFCDPTQLNVDSLQQGNISEAMALIKLQLQYWLGSRIGVAISGPSTIPVDSPLLVFALRNLSNSQDAAILSLAALAAALRRAMNSPASIVAIDESPILFEFPHICALVAQLCANGAKSGISVILSAQDPDTIDRSPQSSKIFQNLSTRLVGYVQRKAIPSFEKILLYPPEIIQSCASSSFRPRKEDLYSQWLLDDNGIFTFTRYYPAEVHLAAVANNPDEQEKRTTALAKYPKQKLKGMAQFAVELATSIRSG